MKTALSFLFSFLLSLTFLSLQAQIQLGNDIDGETPGDMSGSAVSISSDGTVVAIGAPENDGGGNSSGQVRIFNWKNGNWAQMGSDIDGKSGDKLGTVVSLSSEGQRVAIGAPLNQDNMPSSGQVLIYEWQNDDWYQLGQSINGTGNDDRAGTSISLSADGNRVAIGAPRHDGNGNNSGHVRVFEWDGMNWQQLGTDLLGEENDENAGNSVALSPDGQVVAVGAIGAGAGGQIEVYRYGSNSWTRIGNVIDGEMASLNLGNSISLSSNGNRFAAGVPFYPFSGQVRVYQIENGAWTILGQEIDGETSFEQFGSSVSLSSNGNRLAVGTPNGSFSGEVSLFDYKNGEWVQSGDLIDGDLAGDNFGTALSISSTGEHLAVGAPSNDGNGDNSGHVRVYALSSTSLAKSIHDNSWKIYPNPTSGKVIIDKIHADHCEVFDQTGKKVLHIQSPGHQLNISSLPNGIYEIRIHKGMNWGSKKIIKSDL